MNEFALIIHPTHEALLYRYEPGMKHRSKQVVHKLLEWMDPFLASEVEGIYSDTGKPVKGILVMCPLLREQMMNLSPQKLLKQVIAAARLAESLGTKIIGLTAYTSFVGSRGADVRKVLNTPLTNGSTYTMAMVTEAVLRALNLMETPLETANILIVGATSRISRFCLEILGPAAKRIMLFSQGKVRLKGVIDGLRADLQKKVEIIVDIAKYAKTSDVIIFASRNPFIPFDLNKLKPGTIIFDASYPRRIPLNFRDDILVIDGLTIKPPGKPKFGFDFGLPEGLCFPCMAEPIILALEHKYENYSLGGGGEQNLSKASEIVRLASKHGFRIAELTSQEQILPEEEIIKIKKRAFIKSKDRRRSYII
ncbi:MAG: hypothetical protein ABIC18_04095 [Candidatus Omnitrophota bacterium]